MLIGFRIFLKKKKTKIFAVHQKFSEGFAKR